MDWLVLIMLVLIGFILLLLEFMVFPGVNVVGILGFLCVGGAIYVAYSQMGSVAGHLTLAGVGIGGSVMTWFALRSKTWKRLQLDTEIDGSVEGVDTSIQEGDVGVTLGRLAPMGEVRFGGVVAEAESQSGYVDNGQEVVVLKVFKNKIIVKLKTE